MENIWPVIAVGASVIAVVLGRRLAASRRRLLEAERLEREALGKLAGRISHDLNNHLTIMLGYGETLLEELEAGGPGHENAQIVLEAGRMTQDLSARLMAYSRDPGLKEVPEATAPAPETASGAPTEGEAATVLVVDDEPMLRSLATRILVDHGFNVLEAVDGRDALALLEERSDDVDLVLTDVVMPNLGGGGLSRALQERHPHKKVLFMSGYLGEEFDSEGIPVGEEEVLRKPFTSDHLLRAVAIKLEG